MSENGVGSDLAFCLRPFIEKTNSDMNSSVGDALCRNFLFANLKKVFQVFLSVPGKNKLSHLVDKYRARNVFKTEF